MRLHGIVGLVRDARNLPSALAALYTLFTLGVVPWLVYGILIYSWPIIFANCVTLLLPGAVLAMKVEFG